MTRLALRLSVLLALLVVTLPALAQSPDGTALIAQVDTSAFPAMEAYLVVNDAAGNHIAGLAPAAFTVLEDAAAVGGVAAAEQETGVQVVFVLDTSEAFKARDDLAVTRLDYVKQALADFVQTQPWMKDGVDDVTVLAPEGPVIAHSSRGADLAQAVAAYASTYAGAADPFQLLNAALDLASEGAPRPGMRRFIVFFSTGLDTASAQAALNDLAVRARTTQAPIYTVFVGRAEDASDVGARGLHQLAQLTGAEHIVFERPASLTPLFQRLADQRTAYRLSYRSRLAATGQHSLAVTVALPSGSALTTEAAAFPLRVEPPLVTLSNLPATIERAAAMYGVPVAVDFPDGHARALSQMQLLVDGQAVDTQTALVEALNWPLADYAQGGAHTVQVRITDELGLTAESDAVTVALTVSAPSLGIPRAGQGAFTLAVIAGLGAALAVGLLGWRAWTRGRRERAVTPARARSAAAMTTAPLPRLEETRPVKPVRVTRKPPTPAASLGSARPLGRAYLEVLEPGGGGAPRPDIEVLSKTVRLGRDPAAAEAAFNDRSVSRLHARIVEEGGVFKIYDERSTSGTWVNLVQIPAVGGHELHDGDVINLGRVQLRFRRRA